MLRSLYTYKGAHSRTLKFLPDEKFLEIGVSNDCNWVHVINEKGHLGYVPKNYVALDQVPPNEMLDLIDTCIGSIHLGASQRSGNYTRNEHEALQRLVQMRQEWHCLIPPSTHRSKRPAPPLPHRTSAEIINHENKKSAELISSFCQPLPPLNSPQIESNLGITGNEVSTSFIDNGCSAENYQVSNCENNQVLSKYNSGEKRDENQISIPSKNNSSEKSDENQISIPKIEVKNVELDFIGSIPKGYCRKLVEEIRASTNISYSTSHQVVAIVLHSLGSTFPSLDPFVKEILEENVQSLHSNKQTSLHSWEESGDGRKLVDILEQLRQCKDDDQQRSWALHEDELTIKDLIKSLIDILTNGDIEVCRNVLILDDHRPLLTIVQYYQMETRWVLRKLLLQVFAACCQLSHANISYLSSSVLPSELTRVILHSKTSEEELEYTSLVLGMVLSMGDTLPFNHFSIMNEVFIEEVLSGIESYNEFPETENLADLYLTLILAFNLQYHSVTCVSGDDIRKNESENIVIKVLSHRNDTKHFIEKLLILFNREEDPVAMFDHEPHPPHSVLSFMGDLFRCPKTAQLLYTNDEKVVCDIILRQLTDLTPEDKRRHNYLRLLEGVVAFGQWREHQHCRKEFSARLNAYVKQEEYLSNREVAARILLATPELR